MDMYGGEPELNNQQKAAILFIVLGPEYSSMLFKHMNDEEIEKFLGKYQMIIAKPRFYIEGVDKHYINCHKTQHQRCKTQLSILESVIKETQPDYLEAAFAVFEKRLNELESLIKKD